jgi:glycosyltransferase involved in cell wall biosynthesis
MYGQKAHSMRSLFDLPARCGADFELALAIHPGEAPDLRALAEHGWSLTNPAEVAGTPAAYHAFVAASRGEFGVAKSGYVLSRCGWFSDRSACYLACGRPVVAQDTGYGAFLPVGEGLLSFTSVSDAAAAIDRVEGDYERHARAARQLAEEHLDSDVVLTRLIERLGAAS